MKIVVHDPASPYVSLTKLLPGQIGVTKEGVSLLVVKIDGMQFYVNLETGNWYCTNVAAEKLLVRVANAELSLTL